jgi:hypothetical protein
MCCYCHCCSGLQPIELVKSPLSPNNPMNPTSPAQQVGPSNPLSPNNPWNPASRGILHLHILGSSGPATTLSLPTSTLPIQAHQLKSPQPNEPIQPVEPIQPTNPPLSLHTCWGGCLQANPSNPSSPAEPLQPVDSIVSVLHPTIIKSSSPATNSNSPAQKLGPVCPTCPLSPNNPQSQGA